MNNTFDPADYGTYIEQDFRYRWLRPHLLNEKLEKYKAHTHLKINRIGESIEGREINSIGWGEGRSRILCWTQMHGNEPTATLAMIDLLNFLSATDKYDKLRKHLRENIQLEIILMLNPDGAERFDRRNAVGIDLNRDALTQVSPEIQVLMQRVRDFDPHWAFNLHDQRNIFSAGNTDKSATISFLSASADEKKTITPARAKSMKVIGQMATMLTQHIDGHIGRYTDEYYPRALGEYFHTLEIPCILIESGASKNDPFRDMARKCNFLSILYGFELIASGEFEGGDLTLYKDIPQNFTNIFDLVVRGCKLKYKDKTLTGDLGFLYQELPDFETEQLQRHLVLNDLGDLRFNYGLAEEEGGTVNLEEHELNLTAKADLVIERKNKADLIFINGILK